MATQTTVLQQQTIANTPADWSAKVTFAQFDPTLGTLQDVRIDIATTVDGTVSIESLDATPAAITAGLSGAVGVSTGGTQIAADTVAATATPAWRPMTAARTISAIRAPRWRSPRRRRPRRSISPAASAFLRSSAPARST